ncbi:methionine/alanine import family NSS transporter small subunit [Saccharomonospora halophila]|nr:methionine/alanine import family NSS transporter small subunit [Saccharomonospora halophila]
MSTGAIIMLIVSILLVWGGLGVSIALLRRHPEQPDEEL